MLSIEVVQSYLEQIEYIHSVLSYDKTNHLQLELAFVDSFKNNYQVIAHIIDLAKKKELMTIKANLLLEENAITILSSGWLEEKIFHYPCKYIRTHAYDRFEWIEESYLAHLKEEVGNVGKYAIDYYVVPSNFELTDGIAGLKKASNSQINQKEKLFILK